LQQEHAAELLSPHVGVGASLLSSNTCDAPGEEEEEEGEERSSIKVLERPTSQDVPLPRVACSPAREGGEEAEAKAEEDEVCAGWGGEEQNTFKRSGMRSEGRACVSEDERSPAGAPGAGEDIDLGSLLLDAADALHLDQVL